MKTVMPLVNGSISSDSTKNARMVKYEKGKEVTLKKEQADFLVACGKAEEIVAKPKVAEQPKQSTKRRKKTTEE